MRRADYLDRALRHLMSGGTEPIPVPHDDLRDDPFAQALLGLMLVWRGDFAPAADTAARALADATDPDARALARATTGLVTAWWPATLGDQALLDPRTGRDPITAAHADDDPLSDSLRFALHALLAESALGHARLDLAADFLERAGHPPAELFGTAHPFLTFTRGLAARIAVFQGDIDRAEVLADEAVTRADGPTESLFALACAALTQGSADRRRQARRLVDRATAAADPTDAVTRGCFVLASYGARALGDVDLQVRLVLRAGADPDLSQLRIIDRAFGLEALVTSAVDLGDTDAAESWLARLEALADHPIAAPTAARARSRLSLAIDDADAALLEAERAVALAQADGRAVEQAEAEILRARARIARRQAGAAARDLASLVTASEARGYRAIRRSAARELRRVGRRLPPVAASGWPGLSLREREVALLLAKGLSNSALAGELFLSPHTVRAHVTRVLCAFGVATRAGVAAALAHDGVTRPENALTAELTARQKEVVRLIAAGASNAEIAGRLGVSVSTVEKHVSAVMGRWKVRSRAEIAYRAEQPQPVA